MDLAVLHQSLTRTSAVSAGIRSGALDIRNVLPKEEHRRQERGISSARLPAIAVVLAGKLDVAWQLSYVQ